MVCAHCKAEFDANSPERWELTRHEPWPKNTGDEPVQDHLSEAAFFCSAMCVSDYLAPRIKARAEELATTERVLRSKEEQSKAAANATKDSNR